MTAPQAIFAANDTTQASLAQTQAPPQIQEAPEPVGGWSPAEVRIVEDDPEVDNATDLPTFKRNIINADPDSVFTRGVSTVGYDSLATDAQRKYYRALEDEALAFMNAKEDLKVTKMNTTSGVVDVYVIAHLKFRDYGVKNIRDAGRAFYAFDYDHPAYYWISNTVWNNSKGYYLSTDKEYASVDERARINSMVDDGVKEYVAIAENGADTLDKIALIHDQIVNAVDYAYESDGKTPVKTKWAHSVHGLFDLEYRHVVCEGYADAFSLIMNYMGIPNYYIIGKAGSGGSGGGGGHAWNAVSANDGQSYLYMDLTWDDLAGKGYYHKYFGMPSSDFEKTHFKYVPENVGNKWLYPITGNINDEFAATYYKQGALYYDGTGDTASDIVAKGRTKAARVGDYASFMSPSKELLADVANVLGKTLDSSKPYTVYYKGTNYYVIVDPISGRWVDLSAADLTLSKAAYAYTAGPIEPKPVVTCNGVALIKNINYALSYDDNIEVSENAAITATGIGNFTGSASMNFTIYPHTHVWTDPQLNWKADLSEVTATHTCQLEDCGVKTETETAETTSAVTKEPGCTEEGTTTYTAVFQNPAFGTQTKDIPIKALGHNMTGHTAVAATCTEAGSSAYWSCDQCSKFFSDAEGKDEIAENGWVIEALGHEWDEGVVTREPSYTNHGLRLYTCQHDPNHTKTEEIPMLTPQTIVPEMILSPAALTYNGQDQMPEVTVKHGDQILRERTDYVLERAVSEEVGTYSIRVNLQNGYRGSATATYTIDPKGTAITKLLKGKNQLTVKWKKQSTQTTGYQIRCSLKKNFRSGVKTVTVKNAKTTRKVISGLKAGKKYYVQIRTYKKDGGQYYYSTWSKTKSAKTH